MLTFFGILFILLIVNIILLAVSLFSANSSR